MAVFVARTVEIANAIERRDHVGGEPPGFADHRGGGVSVELAEEAFADRLMEAGDMME